MPTEKKTTHKAKENDAEKKVAPTEAVTVKDEAPSTANVKPADSAAPKAEEAPKPAPRKRGRPRKSDAEKAQAAKSASAKKSTKTKSTTKRASAKATKPPKTTRKKIAAATEKPQENKNNIFALDIGTRSVIGIVAHREDDGSLTVIDTERQEHKTRAMLDGQIHDVPQVAAVITAVKKLLEDKVGPLKSVAVAAAGRALYTMTAEAEMEFSGIITSEQERRLDFAGVQAAQAKLAEGGTIDATRYYCVGYSTINYTLDDSQLKTLVGQRGRHATATVIATFLPRQVIDSMDSALQATHLEMKAITLEPIAAINVLIPPTMRHLNLVLVDIGAGTSDVAITKNGSVIAYGMVPMAGDEITEAISQKFLLDFNVAERIKREATKGQDVEYDDILGIHHEVRAKEIIDPILPTVEKLASAIAKQIMDLNGGEPQAVLLVGGGALTPHLADFVTKELSLSDGRVAVRHPDNIEGINNLPAILKMPDAVTPLGILKIASLNTLHFLTIYVGENEYRLFNFRDLTISDALLNAGIQLKNMSGKPGLGFKVTVNGKPEFFRGTMGTMAKLKIDGKDATLDTPIADGSRIEIEPGEDGANPEVTADDVMEMPEKYKLFINGHERELPAEILVNGVKPTEGQLLEDGDVITTKDTRSIGEALSAMGYPPTGKKIHFKLNGSATQYSVVPDILVNDEPATLSMLLHDGDRIEYMSNGEPKLSDVLDLKEYDTNLTIYFNGAEEKIPLDNVTLEVNERPANLNTIISEGCVVRYERNERRATLISHALAAVKFEPPSAKSGMTVEIMLNGKPANISDPIKNGDALDIKITAKEEVAAPAHETTTPAPKPALKQSLLGDDYKAKIFQQALEADKKTEISPSSITSPSMPKTQPMPVPPATPAAPSQPARTIAPSTPATPLNPKPTPRPPRPWDKFK